jgi:trk system potassium uptake protein TrkH
MGSVIALGTLLLALPAAAADARGVGLLVAFFTATSAVCVTGLIVVDTPGAFSGFGQLVILLLIQVGGLGYMTMSTLVAITLGRKVGLHSRVWLQESMNLGSRSDLLKFTAAVWLVTLAFELAGALVLTVRWWADFGPARAAWLGLFHSVSAFNNAGFSLFSTSLIAWHGDVVVNATIGGLIVAGGLGYVVLVELARLRRGRRLSLHSQLVLGVTLVLLLGGAAAVYWIERGNPATIGQQTVATGGMAALFQSLTARTAGFNTLDTAALRPATLFLLMVLMFIGAAPGGTAGGVKVTTFVVTVLALWATVRGRAEPTIRWRRLPAELVARAFLISLTAFLALNVVAGILLVTEQGDLLPTLFEAASAFGTVGLSTGVPGAPVSFVAGFSSGGQLLVCALMFIGRVGPLTMAFALAGRQAAPRVRYPEGRVLIG